MTNDDKQPAGAGAIGRLAVRNPGALVFAADMYGLQLDQLAALTGDERSARAAASRWRALGYAETARLSPGAPWLWVTRAGLAACGRDYRPGPPGLPRLAHVRAVAAARIALEATDAYRAASAYWRCERRIRSRHGVGVRQHLPDAEVHWPDGARGPAGRRSAGPGSAGRSRPRSRRRRSPGPRRSCARSSSAPAITAARPLTSRFPAGRPARPRDLPVLPRRAVDRAARPRRPRPAGRPHRGPRPPARRAAVTVRLPLRRPSPAQRLTPLCYPPPPPFSPARPLRATGPSSSATPVTAFAEASRDSARRPGIATPSPSPRTTGRSRSRRVRDPQPVWPPEHAEPTAAHGSRCGWLGRLDRRLAEVALG